MRKFCYFIKPLKILSFLMVFFIYTQKSEAQVSKPHFVINNAVDTIEVQLYYNILKEFDFDEYRYFDQRRTIKFTNSNITIDLYSAKELLDIYQKPVSPFTIMNNVAIKEISFFLNGGKVQIVTL